MDGFTRPRSPLGRTIDISYRSNVVALLGSALVALAFGLVNVVSSNGLASPWWMAGAAAFLGWAIGRELDPDHNLSAAFAMILAGIGAALVEPSLLFGFGVLLGTRLIASTVGLPFGAIDFGAVVAIAALLGTGGVAVASVPILAIGVATYPGPRRSQVLAAVAAVVATTVAFVIVGTDTTWGGPGLAAALVIAVAAVATVLTVRPTDVVSRNDIDSAQLDPSRIGMARAGAAGSIVLAFLAFGPDGLFAGSVTVVAAIIGVALRSLSGNRDHHTVIVGTTS